MKEPLDLSRLGKQIPWHEPSEEDRARMRASLVSWAETTPHRRINLTRRAVIAALAAVACVAAALLWPWTQQQDQINAPASRAQLTASIDARFDHEVTRFAQGNLQDEVVHLRGGRLELEVASLGPGERFRVLAPDAEIEVRGTRFTVVVLADRLSSVSVIEGRVIVRPKDREARSVGVGESWKAEDVVAEVAPPQAPQPPPIAPRKKRAPPLPVVTAPPPLAKPPVIDPTPPIPPEAPKPRLQQEPAPPIAATRNAEVRFREAWQLFREKRYSAAASAFQETEQLAGPLLLASDASYWRVVCLLRAGDGGATAAIERFLERYPSSPRRGEMVVALAEKRLKSGKLDEARLLFDSVLDDPKEEVRRRATEGLDQINRVR